LAARDQDPDCKLLPLILSIHIDNLFKFIRKLLLASADTSYERKILGFLIFLCSANITLDILNGHLAQWHEANELFVIKGGVNHRHLLTNLKLRLLYFVQLLLVSTLFNVEHYDQIPYSTDPKDTIVTHGFIMVLFNIKSLILYRFTACFLHSYIIPNFTILFWRIRRV